jgi:hypothetical protein
MIAARKASRRQKASSTTKKPFGSQGMFVQDENGRKKMDDRTKPD